MPTCDRCGEELQETNPGGRYRDKCMDCIGDVADEIPSHRETCDDPDCLVCSTP